MGGGLKRRLPVDGLPSARGAGPGSWNGVGPMRYAIAGRPAGYESRAAKAATVSTWKV
jgi:hypothetical protein